MAEKAAHSLCGGVIPLRTQRAVARGLGRHRPVAHAAGAFSTLPSGTGPITLPPHARAVVEAYQDDTL